MSKFVQYKNHQKSLVRYRLTQLLYILYIPHNCDDVNSECRSRDSAHAWISINNKKIEIAVWGNRIDYIHTGYGEETIYVDYEKGESIFRTHNKLILDNKQMSNIIKGNLSIKRFPDHFNDNIKDVEVSSNKLIKTRFNAKMKILRALDEAGIREHDFTYLKLIHSEENKTLLYTTDFSVYYHDVFDWDVHTESLKVSERKRYHLQFKYIDFIANENIKVEAHKWY